MAAMIKARSRGAGTGKIKVAADASSWQGRAIAGDSKEVSDLVFSRGKSRWLGQFVCDADGTQRASRGHCCCEKTAARLPDGQKSQGERLLRGC